MPTTPESALAPQDFSPVLPLQSEPEPETNPGPSPQQIPIILLTDDRGLTAAACPSAVSELAEIPPQVSTEPMRSMPGILLSGDRPASPAEPNPQDLPLASPETPSVWVGAQDPHTLCIQWELPARDLEAAKTSGEEDGVHLRVIAEAPAPQCVSEERLDPDIQIRFVPVPNAGTPYHAEIGTRSSAGDWHTLAESHPTCTPPAAPAQADDYSESLWFQPISPSEPIPEAAPETLESGAPPTVFATDWDTQPVPETFSRTFPIPMPSPSEPSPPTVRASRHLTRLSLGAESADNASSHSLARDNAEEESVMDTVASPVSPVMPGVELPSSEALASNPVEPKLGHENGVASRKFWFRINAEVVIYGSTEPGASVTIGDQEVKVRPDGTFSFRFSLPDGAYPLPVVAASADRRETLAARVELSRTTGFQGAVDAHPQCPTLQPPLPENCR